MYLITIEGGDGLWESPNEGATNESGFTALPSQSCENSSCCLNPYVIRTYCDNTTIDCRDNVSTNILNNSDVSESPERLIFQDLPLLSACAVWLVTAILVLWINNV